MVAVAEWTGESGAAAV